MAEQQNIGLQIDKPPERPHMWCEEIKAAVADALLPEVIAWINGGSLKEDRPEEVRADLLKALEGTSDFDGYEIASELESAFGYSPNADLVDILDNAFGYALDKHKSLEAEWVERFSVKPKYAVGAMIRFKQRRIDQDTHAGEVSFIDERHAQYHVFSAELGHVRKGDGPGTLGIILNFEDVEALNAT